MSLSAKDKARVRNFWDKVSHQIDAIGSGALSRMIAVYPQTKTYFAHWSDLGPDSPDIKRHGKVILGGVSDAIEKIDDLKGGLINLSELHAFQLRVDPANFKLLTHNILVMLAIYYPNEFTPEVHRSMDKFFSRLALALAEKYR
ncbi:hypothetical protein AAFF_G00081530 [Aldrovandia affinis]|uniref:Globin domain-containing protein n=1 Tax=Aldrovandia affinis TaxID=143900 RepID=A0AAD7T558_9TELE|nr:hypothetical protein AAFF_G00081530 [Aldrovandia affinis]